MGHDMIGLSASAVESMSGLESDVVFKKNVSSAIFVCSAEVFLKRYPKYSEKITKKVVVYIQTKVTFFKRITRINEGGETALNETTKDRVRILWQVDSLQKAWDDHLDQLEKDENYWAEVREGIEKPLNDFEVARVWQNVSLED